jgi:glycosyltransferase involved in cell wall biosynthesis
MRKPRVLHVGEFSGMDTGYATYAREINKRLNASGRCEVAELACCIDDSEPKIAGIPWKVYPAIPRDTAGLNAYRADPTAIYGSQAFHHTAVDFQPTHVIDVRDPWNTEYHGISPLRQHYRRIIMPPIDGQPLKSRWLADFINADRCLTYTDWGGGVLMEESGGLANYKGVAPPAADYETFRPLGQFRCRKDLGIDPDTFIVGTVMRSQPRKLYPGLIKAFANFALACDSKCMLYLHTTYPDVGWDLPSLIKNSGFPNRILVTYVCEDCGYVEATRFRDAWTRCSHCGGKSALPSSRHGIKREGLARVINTFDVYVQYANCEGFGMPLVEAAACGVPVMAVDHSAMSDVVRKLHGVPIKLVREDLDQATGHSIAIPDHADLVVKFQELIAIPAQGRKLLGERARQNAILHYNWDRSASTWLDCIESTPAPVPWNAPPRFHQPLVVPTTQDPLELARAAILRRTGRPEWGRSILALGLARDLAWGRTHDKDASRPFGEVELIQTLDAVAQSAAAIESLRCHRSNRESNRVPTPNTANEGQTLNDCSP